MIEHPLEPIIDEQCEVLIDSGRLLVQSHKQTMKQ